MLTDVGALLLGQLLIGDQAEVELPQAGQQFAQHLSLALLHPADFRVAFCNLLARTASIGRHLQHPGDHLLLEAADPFHEEFVQVGGGDGEKLKPLQRRIARIRGLGKDPLVEGQPRQFAIEVQLGARQVADGRYRHRFHRRRVAGR